MKTIQDIRDEVARAVKDFTPAGYRAKVALQSHNGKKIRKDASARNWDPVSGSISITFVKPEDPEEASEIVQSELKPLNRKMDESVETVGDFQNKAMERNEKREKAALASVPPSALAKPEVPSGLPEQLVEAIRALDSAEQRVSFVALKWFRDQELPKLGGRWSAVPGANQEIVKQAIEQGIFLTNKVHNPKSPAFPTTAIRLNRQSAEVQKLLGSSAAAHSRIFRPVGIKGAGLSDTILQERG